MKPLNKKTPNIPDNYFKELSEKVKQQISESDTFDWSTYPILYSYIGKNAFKIPPGYFSTLNDYQSLSSNIKKQKYFIRLKIAASLLAFLSLAAIFNSYISNVHDPNPQFMANQSIEYNLDELKELDDSALEKLLGQTTVELEFDQIEDDVMLEYIMAEMNIEELNTIL